MCALSGAAAAAGGALLLGWSLLPGFFMQIRLPFHDCGTFDIGNTGSVGDAPARGPRFGCNGSLRKEVGVCEVCFEGGRAMLCQGHAM